VISAGLMLLQSSINLLSLEFIDRLPLVPLDKLINRMASAA